MTDSTTDPAAEQRPLTNTELAELDQAITENTPGMTWTCELVSPFEVKFSTTDQKVEITYTSLPVSVETMSRFNGKAKASLYAFDRNRNLIPFVHLPENYFEQVFQMTRDQLDMLRQAGLK